MDKKTNYIVENYIDCVLKIQPDLIAAYIFGSYAKNKQSTDSDIDIALVIDNLTDINRFDTQVKLMILASKIDNRIEPHLISKQDLHSNHPFVNEVTKTGIQLKIR
ncbi:MAG: nucleotidyltransferase domain-containing protein [Paludibacter sp.]|nr:nucleotidyltransferase domain-containing protein [Paludibacter sp.]